MSTNEIQKAVGNVHTHHFIADYLPDAIFNNQTGRDEKKLRSRLLYVILGLISIEKKGRFLRLLRSNNVNKIREAHLKDMKSSGVNYSVVLLVDYSMSAPKFDREKLSHYRRILKETALSCAKNPFQFYLFHYFDPRFMVMVDRSIGKKDFDIEIAPGTRKTYTETTFAIRLLLKAFYEYGIVGLKIYPAHGYHPVPEENENKDHLIQVYDEELLDKEREIVSHNLKFMYKFAHENNLPILSHCGPGGSYNLIITERLKGRHVWSFTNPKNFDQIIQSFKNESGVCGFKVCLAHMGGKTHLPKEEDLARIWYSDILDLIENHPGNFYADLSYDISTFLTKEIKDKKLRKKELYDCLKKTRKFLENNSYGDYILFGSDWPMGIALYSERDYTNAYEAELKDNMQISDRYFSDNIAKFLFGEDKQIPDNYIQFIKKEHGGTMPSLPPWILEQNGKYYLG